MKITIYELLGLIKERKAPKKIKLDSFIFELINNMYINNEMGLLDEYISITNQLNTKIEIIEEEQDIEELNIQRVWHDDFRNEPLLRYMYKEDIKDIENKINELIKAVNELKKNER